MLPLLPGVYIIRDGKNEVIYVGKAKRLRDRVSQYFRESVPHDAKTTRMINTAREFDVIVTNSENEALILEASQIKLYSPKYNILLKDDKGYSYVRVSNEAYPRITAELQMKDDDAQYIGPYLSHFAVRQMVENAVTTFRLPTCNRKFPEEIGKERPCLNYHIQRCMGVCTGKIQHDDYLEDVSAAVRLIKGGKKEILKNLKEQMEAAAENLQFERAAQIRNQIQAIEKVQEGQAVVAPDKKSQDFVAVVGASTNTCAAVLRFRDGRLVDKQEFVFYDSPNVAEVREAFLERYYVNGQETPKVIGVDVLPENAEVLTEVLTKQRGSKVQLYKPEKGDAARLVQMAYLNATERLAREHGRGARELRVLDELANLLGLPEPPAVIESYDISNWGEGTSVCGMVVFENGKPKKSGYRKFKIKTVAGTDDYASLAEVLSRRVAEYEKGATGQFGTKPDLILLDGGKGQVSAVQPVLAGTAFEDVPLFGMVKDDKHRTRAITTEKDEIAIAMHKGVFKFVTSIQDEVHRFSITYQRASHKKKSFSSSLTQIEGVGEGRAKALLTHFKTIKAIQEASEEELAQAKGVTKAAAKAVYEHYHPQA